jgi:hypothetical protein
MKTTRDCHLDIRTPGGRLIRRTAPCRSDDYTIALDERQKEMVYDAMTSEMRFLEAIIKDNGNLTIYANALDAVRGILEQLDHQMDERRDL